jgi:tetratricopeptide (TPR) repeat protein
MSCARRKGRFNNPWTSSAAVDNIVECPDDRGDASRLLPNIVTDGEAPLARGTSVSRFVVVDRIGVGGMGAVYSAYDPELDRSVALKLIAAKPGKQSETSRERLLREAQAMAKVSHPNVVHVYDVGVWNDRVFIAMELVNGETLREWMERNPDNWEQALALFVAAGRGLMAAHAAGIVHRDFKPDNVLVGKDGRVRVTDFGLARPAGATLPSEELSQSPTRLQQRITHTGTIMGTPAYMAPEQMTNEPLDERADVFSFCVALYEALYGQRPFAADSQRALLAQIATGRAAPPPPSSHVPQRLRAILLRGLRATPEQRFATMESLLAELKFDPGLRRRRLILASAGVLVVASIVVGVVAIQRLARSVCNDGSNELAGVWDESRRESVRHAFLATGLPYASTSFESAAHGLDRLVGNWKAMHLQACQATRVRGVQSAELLDLRMQCLENQRRALATTTQLFSQADAKIVEQAVTATAALPSADACADGNALRGPIHPTVSPALKQRLTELGGALAEVRAQLGLLHLDEAIRRAKAILDEARAAHDQALEAEALFLMGRALDLEDKREAEQTLKDAIVAGETSRAERTLAEAWTELVTVQSSDQVDNRAEAAESARHANAYISRLDSDRLRMSLSLARASLASLDGRWDDSSREGTLAVEAARRAYGENSYELATALAEQARVTSSEPDYLPRQRHVLAMTERLFGADHPNTAHALFRVAVAADHGEMSGPIKDERIALLRRGIAIYEKTFGPDTEKVAWGYSRLGDELGDRGQPGDFEEAIAQEERAMRVFRRSNPNGFLLAKTLTAMASIYILNHQLDKASLRLDEAERVLKRSRGKSVTYVGWFIARERGMLFREQHRYDESVRAFEQAMSIMNIPTGDATTKIELAETLALRHHTGDIARAIATAEEARASLLTKDVGAWEKSSLGRIDKFLAQYALQPSGAHSLAEKLKTH